MSKWPKVMIAIVMVLALVAVGCAPKEAAAPEAEKTITVGILGALTGPLSSIGAGATCLHDYWTELNATEGGIKYNDPQTGKEEVVRIKVLMGDHGWDVAKCISLYERFKAGGMQFVYANGSAPASAIYAMMERDQLPGVIVNSTVDPFVYELEKPYLAMDGPPVTSVTGPVISYYSEKWKEEGKPGKIKVGNLAADVATRRVYDNDEDFGFITYCTDVLDTDFLGNIYMPIGAVDVKAELSHFIEGEANYVNVDHWASGACRIVLENALELGMHKKGIELNLNWMGADVALALPELFEEYNEYSTVQCGSHGWTGTEPPDVVAEYPGLELVYHLSAKYHDGKTPEQMGGHFYVYGVEYGMLGNQAIKETLEKAGYDAFSTEELRDALFGLSPIDTGGLLPTFYPDAKIFNVWPCMQMCDIRDGHIVTVKDRPWLFLSSSKSFPDYKITVTPEWQDKVWFAPGWK